MKILIVLTSHDQPIPETGFWLEEFAAPYYVLKDGSSAHAPHRRRSAARSEKRVPEFQTELTKRF